MNKWREKRRLFGFQFRICMVLVRLAVLSANHSGTLLTQFITLHLCADRASSSCPHSEVIRWLSSAVNCVRASAIDHRG